MLCSLASWIRASVQIEKQQLVPVPEVGHKVWNDVRLGVQFGLVSDASCLSARQCRYHTRSMNAFYATMVLLSTKQKLKPKIGVKRPQNRVSLVRISLSITKVGNRPELFPILTWHTRLIVIQMGWMGACSTFAVYKYRRASTNKRVLLVWRALKQNRGEQR